MSTRRAKRGAAAAAATVSASDKNNNPPAAPPPANDSDITNPPAGRQKRKAVQKIELLSKEVKPAATAPTRARQRKAAPSSSVAAAETEPSPPKKAKRSRADSKNDYNDQEMIMTTSKTTKSKTEVTQAPQAAESGSGTLRRSNRAATKASTAASAATFLLPAGSVAGVSFDGESKTAAKRTRKKKDTPEPKKGGKKGEKRDQEPEPTVVAEPVKSAISSRNRKKTRVSTETDDSEATEALQPASSKNRGRKRVALPEIVEETRPPEKDQPTEPKPATVAKGRSTRKQKVMAVPETVEKEEERPDSEHATKVRSTRKKAETKPSAPELEHEQVVEVVEPSKATRPGRKGASKTVVEKKKEVALVEPPSKPQPTKTAKPVAAENKKLAQEQPPPPAEEKDEKKQKAPLVAESSTRSNRRAARNLTEKLTEISQEPKRKQPAPRTRTGAKKADEPVAVHAEEPKSVEPQPPVQPDSKVVDADKANPDKIDDQNVEDAKMEEQDLSASEPTITEPTDEANEEADDDGKERFEPAVEIESRYNNEIDSAAGDSEENGQEESNENQTYLVEENSLDDVASSEKPPPPPSDDVLKIEECIENEQKDDVKEMKPESEPKNNVSSEETIIVMGMDESKSSEAKENGTAKTAELEIGVGKRKIDEISPADLLAPATKRARGDEMPAGDLFTMGDQISKELGPRLTKYRGEKVRMNQPTRIQIGPHRVTQVAMGALHTLAVTETGRILSFGCNDDFVLGRQLVPENVNGDGEKNDDQKETELEDDWMEKMAGKPALVEGIDAKEFVVKVSAGDMHSAALTENGHVYIWGNFKDESDKLGLFVDDEKAPQSGDHLPTILPRRVEFDRKVVDIASGSHHMLMLADDGQVYSFGEGSKGQLGRITSNELNSIKTQRELFLKPQPVSIPGSPRVARIFSRQWNSFALTEDGHTVYGWGLNNFHQLGLKNDSITQANSLNSGSLNVLIPTRIPMPFRCVQVANGQQHSLALDTDGNVYSCGSALYGKLGHGQQFARQCERDGGDQSISEFKRIERRCFGDDPVYKIDCGDFSSMAITVTGRLYCWGQGSRCIGTEEDDDLFEPRAVSGAYAQHTKFLTISAGAQMAAMVGQIVDDDAVDGDDNDDGQ